MTVALAPNLITPVDPAAPTLRLDTLPAGIPDLTLGWWAIKWNMQYLIQPDGPHAGQPFEHTMRQIRFWLWWYAVNPDGSWVFQHGVRRLAKGHGKSPGAAVWAIDELLAPTRLKDFDAKAPGGCVAEPVGMPLVQIAAVSEAQTKNTMRFVRAFIPKNGRIAKKYNIDWGLTRFYTPDNGGELEVLTSSAATAEGALATAIVGDETEWWLGDTGKDFFNTLADNASKLGNRMIETCNAWQPGKHSHAESMWNTWVDQEERLSDGRGRKEGSPLTLYDARMAPPETDLADYDSLLSALEWVNEDVWWINNQTRISRIWHKSSRPDDSKRKYLNWPTAAEGKWCDPQKWAALSYPRRFGGQTRELMDGERVVVFFDGSKTRDATAAMGCCLDDGHVFTIGVWEPKDQVPVDAEQIDNRMRWVFDTFDVVAFFADVREWEGYVKTTWPERWKDELEVWAVPGGKLPEPIAWDMRSHRREFALAAELVWEEIDAEQFTHDGNAVVARHVGNAHEYETQWNGAISVRKETPNSPDKIDACVCVIGARMVYRLALAGTEPEEESEAYAVRIRR
jgi:hypothetical protein